MNIKGRRYNFVLPFVIVIAISIAVTIVIIVILWALIEFEGETVLGFF